MEDGEAGEESEKEEDREVKERTAGTHQEERREGSGGHRVESRPL